MMNDTARASVIPPGGDYTDPLQQNYKLYVFRKSSDGQTYVLYDDGHVAVKIGEGVEYPPPTLVFPPEYAVAIYEALGKALGKDKPDNPAVLREWLDQRPAKILPQINTDEIKNI